MATDGRRRCLNVGLASRNLQRAEERSCSLSQVEGSAAPAAPPTSSLAVAATTMLGTAFAEQDCEERQGGQQQLEQSSDERIAVRRGTRGPLPKNQRRSSLDTAVSPRHDIVRKRLKSAGPLDHVVSSLP